MAVHNVQVQPLGSGTIEAFRLVSEPAEITGQQRWGNNHGVKSARE
jgi:hypothetical protein